ncbi:MAG: M1 family aminopeptidase, partial [Acidobacteriota bacterium]|nr:M1 family aminopeptidase [Acidobacteriota bacterium]
MLQRFLISAAFILMMTTQIFPQTPTIETGVPQTLAKWRAANYSDVRYKLNLTLEKMSPTLKGTIEISLKNNADQIVLDWRKIRGKENLSTISNVSVNGNSVVLSPDFSRLSSGAKPPEGGTQNFYEINEHLVFKEGVIKGENVIKLDFTSPILTSGGAITRYVDKEDGAEYVYSLFVPSDASTAFPVFDQPDLKARFELELTVPSGWEVVTNTEFAFGGDIDCEKKNPCGTTHHFRTTKPISTYVFAFAAGNFEVFYEKDTKNPLKTFVTILGSSRKTLITNLLGSRIYVRKSQAEKFKQHADEVFRLNREGVRFLESWFDYKFPFPKYDLVLIPEFPFGGMEHAGATFLREDRVIFPTEPTKNDYITRANLIFHEAAHQWFGDTVTMKWFDDLWLKEGFAEFIAYKTLEKVMPEYNAWKIFYERNKQLAYLTDSTRGTTPIYQEIPNLSAAKSAYGNIVYRKAPSFLKQAEFYLGADKFQTAVRAFLKKHQFANASWQDLVKEFEEVKVAETKKDDFYQTLSARDKKELEKFTRWSINKEWAEFWVEKRGMPTYRISPDVLEGLGLLLNGGATGGHTLFMRDFSQKGSIENYNWLQNIRVLKVYDNGEREEAMAEIGNRRYAALPDKESKGLRKGEFTFSDAYKDLDENVSKEKAKVKNPLFVFPNYQDYGYGIFLLDEK